MWSLRTSWWKPSGVASRFVRKVRTASGAVAVQVVMRRGRQVEHVGSAHTDAELTLLLAAARERLSPGQDVLDLGALPVVPARMDDVADWTAEPELPLQPATPAAGGRPAVVAAGGRVLGTGLLKVWLTPDLWGRESLREGRSPSSGEDVRRPGVSGRSAVTRQVRSVGHSRRQRVSSAAPISAAIFGSACSSSLATATR